MGMKRDTARLLQYGFLGAVLVAAHFGALVLLPINIIFKSLLGWVGIGLVVLFYRFSQRHEPKPANGKDELSPVTTLNISQH